MKAIELFKTVSLPESLREKANESPAKGPEQVDHVAHMINSIASEAKKIKQQEAALASQRKALEELIDQAETILKQEMTLEGICELQGVMVKYQVSQSPAKLIIEDEALIPKEYFQETVVKSVRKDAIKDQLKLGDVIPGAKLEYGTTLKLLANKE